MKGTRGITLEREEETGGFVRNPRINGPPRERPWKQKTPRHRRDPLEELSTVIIPEEQAQTVVVKPPEKNKEVKEMETNETTAATRPEFEICPLCGFNKTFRIAENGQSHRYLVCKGCNDEYSSYAAETAKAIKDGRRPEMLTKFEWVYAQLNLPLFNEEHQRTLRERDGLHDWAVEKAKADAHTLGKAMPVEVFSSLVKTYEEGERSNRQFRVMKAWARLQAATKLKPELERIIAEAAKKAAETAPATTALIAIPEPVTNP